MIQRDSLQPDANAGMNRVRALLELIKSAGWDRNDSLVRSIGFAGVAGKSGTTRLVSMIAQAAAGKDVATLIIDANTENPQLDAIFNLDAGVGTFEVLVKPELLQQAVRATHVRNLNILPMGKRRRVEQRYLDSFQPMLRELMADYELILVDMPAIRQGRATNGWLVYCDALMLVAPLGRCDASQLRRVRRVLDGAGAQITGVVENRHPQMLR